MKSTYSAVFRLTILTLAALSLTACDDKKSSGQAQQAAVEVGTVSLTTQRVELTTELPGRTSAFRVAEVRPQVSGIVTKRLFQEGTEVKAGQQLYQIDPAPYQATLASAKADLAKAEASLRSVKAKAARYADLVAINAVSRQDYDDIVSSQEQYEAQIAAARAAVTTAQINVDYTRVFSPISGRIGKSSVTEGALVTANQTTTLATITQLDPIYVDVTQPSGDMMRLRRAIESGHLQGGETSGAPVNLTVEGSGLTYGQTGQLQFSDVTVDQTTGSVTLRALFSNPNRELLPGMFVRAKILQGVKEDGILVPQPAVARAADGSSYVWMISPDGKAVPHPITTSQIIGDKWLVSDGLKSGDQVIIDGLQRLRPGTAVKAAQAGTAPSTAARQTP